MEKSQSYRYSLAKKFQKYLLFCKTLDHLDNVKFNFTASETAAHFLNFWRSKLEKVKNNIAIKHSAPAFEEQYCLAQNRFFKAEKGVKLSIADFGGENLTFFEKTCPGFSNAIFLMETFYEDPTMFFENYEDLVDSSQKNDIFEKIEDLANIQPKNGYFGSTRDFVESHQKNDICENKGDFADSHPKNGCLAFSGDFADSHPINGCLAFSGDLADSHLKNGSFDISGFFCNRLIFTFLPDLTKYCLGSVLQGSNLLAAVVTDFQSTKKIKFLDLNLFFSTGLRFTL
jgi:hypothetical protein